MSKPKPIDYDALPILQPEQAVALWQQGKDAWNAWVKNNPDYNVSFEDVTFPKGDVSFKDFRFPRGRIIFTHANFGGGNVLFRDATFGDGDVSFDRATFGDGQISFIGTRFGNGDVLFDYAIFGNGDVKFFLAKFGDGDVSFTAATFGNGDVFFDGATFGDGNASFAYANFGGGDVSFRGANFGDGAVSFKRATFGDGDVSFRQTNFGDDEVLFIDTTFGNGNVDFHLASMASGNFIFYPASLGKGNLSFSPMSFPGRAVFKMKDASKLDSLSFKRCSFAKVFELQGKFTCVPDLCSTGTLHHVDLSGLTCDFPRANAAFLQKAADRKDIARLRRLKELAESNKHDTAALQFNALEMRASRWTEYSWRVSFLDFLYQIFSDYGRSILWPAGWLLATIGVFTVVFAGLSPTANACTSVLTNALTLSSIANAFTSALMNALTLSLIANACASILTNALTLSLSNCLPFLPLTRDLHQAAVQALGISPELLVGRLSLVEGMLAFLFLFLIGLGLRNHFRL